MAPLNIIPSSESAEAIAAAPAVVAYAPLPDRAAVLSFDSAPDQAPRRCPLPPVAAGYIPPHRRHLPAGLRGELALRQEAAAAGKGRTPHTDAYKAKVARRKAAADGADDLRGYRALQWQRFYTAKDLLPSGAARRCMSGANHKRRLEGGGPSIVKGEHSCRFAYVNRCKSPSCCPQCSAYLAEERRELLEGAVDRWRAAGHGFLAGTFTASHTVADGLAFLLPRLKKALRELLCRPEGRRLLERCGVVHYVSSTEITWGQDSGWHPHKHVLFFTSRHLTEAEAAAFQAELTQLWITHCWRQGLVRGPEVAYHMLKRSVRLKVGYKGAETYLEKHGREPRWSLAAEVAKGNVKCGRKKAGLRFAPFQLLDGIVDPACPVPSRTLEEKYREYYHATLRTHPLRWSPGAKKALGCVELDKPEVTAEERELVCTTILEYSALDRLRKHLPVLVACEAHGLAGYVGIIGDIMREALAKGIIQVGDVYEGRDGRWRPTDQLWARLGVAAEPPASPSPALAAAEDPPGSREALQAIHGELPAWLGELVG